MRRTALSVLDLHHAGIRLSYFCSATLPFPSAPAALRVAASAFSGRPQALRPSNSKTSNETAHDPFTTSDSVAIVNTGAQVEIDVRPIFSIYGWTFRPQERADAGD
jgi:hypothetical protein